MSTTKLVERARLYCRSLAKFIGPGFMIAVGYLDPGNWATDMEGGSRFGYRLLFVILIANLIAVFLQNLTIRLGTVSGLDLAAASRRFLPRYLNLFLYCLAEIAIVATDLAEVIGSAIALHLLFPNLPLPAGVAITAADVLIILLFYNEEPGDADTPSTSSRLSRYFEWFVMALVAAVGICFMVELAFSDIVVIDVIKGYIPTSDVLTDPDALYVAIGILGATVMPHNLYLHSYIVQSRCHEWRSRRPRVTSVIKTESAPAEDDQESGWSMMAGSSNQLEERDARTAAITDMGQLRDYLSTHVQTNLHYGFIDLLVALSFAFFVNSAILVVASANFYYGPTTQAQQVSDLFAAHSLLKEYLSSTAALVFALALLFAGQSSTLTATLAGQVVMSGFLGMTTRPWIRRIVTRLIAIVPAMLAACLAGRTGLSQMLVASQVALSIQLPFAVLPLVLFTGWKRVMKLDLIVEEDKDRPKRRSPAPSSPSWLDRCFHPLEHWYQKAAASLSPYQRLSTTTSSAMAPSLTSSTLDDTPESEQAMPLLPREASSPSSPATHLSAWPQPLYYPNSTLTNICAGLIAAVLIGLNAYMTITFFIGPNKQSE